MQTTPVTYTLSADQLEFSLGPTRYVKTAEAVAAWDLADLAMDQAETADEVHAAAEAWDAAEARVIECWADEAAVFADGRTAELIRELTRICESELRFLRHKVLKMPRPGQPAPPTPPI